VFLNEMTEFGVVVKVLDFGVAMPALCVLSMPL
jgi:hypothetical protein